MDAISHYWNEFWTYFREGLAHVNLIQAVVIALLGMLATSSVLGVFIAAALSVVIHILVNQLWPVLFAHGSFAAPKMDNTFWHMVVTLYILYLVAIGVLYAIKSLLQRARG
jgi:hypothetical protein